MSSRIVFTIIAAVSVMVLQGCDSKSGGTAPGGSAPGKELETNVTMTDIEGNVYRAVTIGTQVWTIENLKVTKYRNGDPIPNVTKHFSWSSLTTGAYCNYGNDTGYVSTYGRLYNWYSVVDNRNIAPEGWHVPTDAEWQTLSNYLGGSSVAGGKMKEAGTTHWDSPNTGATNQSGFSALPGGYRYSDGVFDLLGRYAYFWSTSEKSRAAWSVHLDYATSDASLGTRAKHDGLSVRLVRD